MTSIVTSQLPAGSTLEMPCNNLLSTAFTTASASSLGLNNALTRVLFVDGTLGTAGGDGTIGNKVATIPQAIALAVANAWGNVQLMISPGTYPTAVVCPISLSVVCNGYDVTALDQPILGGAWTFTNAGTAQVGFVNCLVTAPSINAAAQDLTILAWHSDMSCAVNGAVVTIEYHDTMQSGAVTASAILQTFFDGPAWSKTLTANPAFLATTTYSRTFGDAGHDSVSQNVTVNGVVIGTTVPVVVAVPAFVRADDRVQVQVADPTVVDFRLEGVHGVAQGAVTVWLTNISRVSTNFDEPCLFTVHHMLMTAEIPVP